MHLGSTHGKRWMTAAISLPILILVLVWGGKIGFACIVSLAAALALLEYYGLLLPEETMGSMGLGVLCCLSMMVAFFFGRETSVMAVLTGTFIAVSFFYLYRESQAKWAVDRLSKQMLGLVYVPVFLGHLIWVRNGQDGLVRIIMLLAIVFANDTGAYYTGKNFGKKKLCPRISPGKTVEGALGGLAAGMAVALVVQGAAFPRWPWFACLLIAAITGAVAQVGDLAESVLKRSVEVKDSGRLLPGHGGILDRIDGLLFATPVFYYLVSVYI